MEEFSMSDVVFHGAGHTYMQYFGDMLVQLAEIGEGKRILDEGTGFGSSLIPAAMRTGREGFVIGMDIDEEAVQETSGRINECGLANAMMIRMNAAHLAFKDNAFDLVLSGFLGWDDTFNFAINEFVGPRNKIEGIYRVLREGGRLGISTWLSIEDTEWMGQSVYASLIKLRGVIKEAPILYSKENEKGVRILLSSIGFTDVSCAKEHYSMRFFNGEEYWEKMLAKGWRTHLIAMKLKSEELEKLKADVIQRLENRRHTDGFYFSTSVIYAFGTK